MDGTDTSYRYGGLPELVAEIIRYSNLNEYRSERFKKPTCDCGEDSFELATDDGEGVGLRCCAHCGQSHWMGDSADYADSAVLVAHQCVCGSEIFQLLVGLALYQGTEDVRWLYIGCRCTACELIGVFADWKCESGFVADLMAKL